MLVFEILNLILSTKTKSAGALKKYISTVDIMILCNVFRVLRFTYCCLVLFVSAWLYCGEKKIVYHCIV